MNIIGKYIVTTLLFICGFLVPPLSGLCPTEETYNQKWDDFDIAGLEQLTQQFESCPKELDTLKAWIYHSIGVGHYINWTTDNEISSINKAIAATKQSLQIRKELYGKNGFFVGRSEFNLGAFYTKINNFKEAEKHLKKALDIFTIHYDSTSTYDWDFEAALELMGLYGTSTGDYDKSFNYYKIMLNIAEERNNLEMQSRAAITYSNQLQSMERYEEGLRVAEKGIECCKAVLEKTDLAGLYLNAGIALYELNKYDIALSYCKKALGLTKDEDLKWKILTNIGEIHTRKKEYNAALMHLEKALDIAVKAESNDNIAYSFNHIGYAYLHQKKYEDALGFFHKSIVLSVDNFDDTNVASNPSVSLMLHVERKSVLLEYIAYKARCYKGLAQQQDKAKNLNLALQNYQLASKLIDLMREDFTASGSKLHWLKEAYPLLENGIEVALDLFELTGEMEYKRDILNFMEKNKAVLLLESVGRNKEVYFMNIPDSLLQRHANLKREIASKERALLDLQKTSEFQHKDSIRNELEKSLALVKINFSDLEETLSSDYPEFGQSSKISTTGLEEIRKRLLNQNQVLIEYFVGDSTTYIAGISKNEFILKSILTKDIQKNTEALLYVLHPSRRQKGMSEKFFTQFCDAAHALYNLLLKEVLNEFSDEVNRLIIVPDDVISYMPFDVFLQMPVKLGKVNFSPEQLNYLINDYTISYAYSGTILADSSATNALLKNPAFLGFAPGFKGSGQLVAEGRACNFETPEPLKYNQLEVEHIQAITKGEVRKGNKATKAEFLTLASQFSILHLATHACADSKNSSLNRIFFEDDHLYNHELANLNSNADMVVLSACETGIGEFKRGEGVMSLARGFAYSGTPSITMSLWSVNDESTAELMVNYYKYLVAGQDKDTALRNAKLDYLANQEEFYKLHPLFWASFVHYGQTVPFQKYSSRILWYLGAGVLFLFLLGLIKYLRENG